MMRASDALSVQSPLARPGQNLVDSSAELLVELGSARESLADAKLSRADRIAGRVLHALATTRQETARPGFFHFEDTLPLVAAATGIRGRVAQQQFRSTDAVALFEEAVAIWSQLLADNVELDAAARSEYLEILLLAGRGQQAIEVVQRMLESGDVPVDSVLRVAKWQEGSDPLVGIELLNAARRRRPDESRFAAAQAGMLEHLGRLEDAALAHVDTAVLLAGEGDLNAAAEHFEHALAVAPSLAVAIVGLAQVRLWQGRPGDSLSALESADARARSSDLIALRAFILAELERYDEAFRTVAEGIGEFGDLPVLVRARVQLNLDIREFEAALADLRTLLSDDSDDPGLRLMLARAQIGLGRTDEPLEILDALGDEFPDNAVVPALTARVAAMAGKNDVAVAAMLQAMSADASADEVQQVRTWLVDQWIEFADAHLSDPHNDLVLEIVADALAIAPDLARPHALMGECLRQRGNYDEALEHLREAERLDPESGWTVGTLGQVLAAKGDPEAIDVLVRAAKLNDGLAWIHIELADAYRLAGSLDQGLVHADRAIEIDSDQPWAWAVRGAVQSLMERWDDAKDSLEQALRLAGDYGWALAVKASVHLRINELRPAYDTVRAALAADDSLGWAWGVAAFVIDRMDGDPGEQLAAARRAVDLDGTDLSLQAILGDSLARSNAPDEACAAFRKVIEMFGDQPSLLVDTDSQQLVAWSKLRLNQAEDALGHLGIAVAGDPARLDVAFDLGLALLCLGRFDRAFTEYECAIGRVLAEPHPGRQRALVSEALHNIRQLQRQGTLADGAEVRSVVSMLTTVREGNPMAQTILTPTRFGCSRHSVDLTTDVATKVAAEPTFVADLGFRRSGRPAGVERPFEVYVDCPGSAGGQDGHLKRFRGSYRLVTTDESSASGQ